jgi:hypothetical protein
VIAALCTCNTPTYKSTMPCGRLQCVVELSLNSLVVAWQYRVQHAVHVTHCPFIVYIAVVVNATHLCRGRGRGRGRPAGTKATTSKQDEVCIFSSTGTRTRALLVTLCLSATAAAC